MAVALAVGLLERGGATSAPDKTIGMALAFLDRGEDIGPLDESDLVLREHYRRGQDDRAVGMGAGQVPPVFGVTGSP